MPRSTSSTGGPSPLKGHRKIGIDANVLIYLLGDVDARAELVRRLLARLEAGELVGVASVLALTEVLTGPAQQGKAHVFEEMARILTTELPIEWLGVNVSGAVDAAWVRGTAVRGFSDAIQLTTVRSSGATAFVTNDARVRSIARLDVIRLDDLAPEGHGDPEE